MGLLSWLFESKNKKTEITTSLNGPGTFSAEIVGESHYQENIKKISGGYSEDGIDKDVMAKLIHDDDNPYDNKAISIEIDGHKVGHLSKSAAIYYRKKIIDHNLEGQTITCRAKIRGGWKRGEKDFGLYGVVLDLPHDFIEGFEVESVDTVETDNSRLNMITFYIDKKNYKELKECKIGDHVNFWAPDNEPTKIYIFRRGSIGGSGKIGYVPSKYSCIISSHLSKGLEYETEILESNTGKIKCRLISKEETEAKRSMEMKEAAKRLSVELQKKYKRKPKDSFEIKISLPKNHNQIEGNTLFLEEQPIENYTQNPSPLCIKFTDKHENIVAQKTSEPSLVRRILRAYFSDYMVTIKILPIQKTDNSFIPYIDGIEAKAAKAIVTYKLRCTS